MFGRSAITMRVGPALTGMDFFPVLGIIGVVSPRGTLTTPVQVACEKCGLVGAVFRARWQLIPIKF